MDGFAAVDAGNLICGDDLEHVGLTAHQLSECRSGIGNDAPDHAVELRATPIVPGVGDELDSLPGIPPREPKAA